MRRKYGWIPDRPDPRDVKYSVGAPVIPKDVDLREKFVITPYDQQTLSSCTANAIAAAIQYDEMVTNKVAFHPSRLFIYYNERYAENTTLSDSGAMIRDGIKTIAIQGVCYEVEWQYDTDKYAIRPSANCFKNALEHKAIAYKSLNNLNKNELIACLLDGSPFVFGITVFSSFESDEVAKTGIVSMPNVQIERNLGGHALSCFGFSVETDSFLVLNSWGADWGQKGWCWIPSDYLISDGLADDFWQIKKVM